MTYTQSRFEPALLGTFDSIAMSFPVYYKKKILKYDTRTKTKIKEEKKLTLIVIGVILGLGHVDCCQQRSNLKPVR